MSQTVEEILTAVQQLLPLERERLLKALQREAEPVGTDAEVQSTLIHAGRNESSAQLPASREAEMQWLLDHPDFWDQHRGEHVALWGYEMIAVGKTGKEVVAEARRRGIKFPFVQYLPENENEWLLGMSNQPVVEP